VELTRFNFAYHYPEQPGDTPPPVLEFDVNPGSNPPSYFFGKIRKQARHGCFAGLGYLIDGEISSHSSRPMGLAPINQRVNLLRRIPLTGWRGVCASTIRDKYPHWLHRLVRLSFHFCMSFVSSNAFTKNIIRRIKLANPAKTPSTGTKLRIADTQHQSAIPAPKSPCGGFGCVAK
jgi:hypothetical protein